MAAPSWCATAVRHPTSTSRAAQWRQARALGIDNLEATERRTFDGSPVHRVRFGDPGDSPVLRARLHRAKVPTYEADVRFPYRYLIDRGIRSALRIHGDAQPLGAAWPGAPQETVAFDEPEVEPARWTPPLTTLSLDIETDPEAQRLLSVALWGCGAREVLLLCPDAAARAACPGGAIACASEAELLAKLCRRVRALDPDVVTGWNIIDFDVPVLIRRAAELQVPLELGRAPGSVRQRGGGASGRRFSDSIFIPGRVVLDGIRLLRAVSYRLDSYSLENAAREILGEGKTLGGADHGALIMHTFSHDPERFVEYNLTDARLVLDILDKLQLVPFTAERSALTGIPPDRVGSSIAAFDFLYLSRLYGRQVVAPTVGAQPRRNGNGQERMYGGHILKPRPGLHEDVLLFDFKSLYPSIIRTFQIDPLGLIRDPEEDQERCTGSPRRTAPSGAGTVPHTAPGEMIEAPNGARFLRERGILSELLDELFTSRENAKAAGNTIASNAIKVLMNSFYGALGAAACRFSDRLLANAIHQLRQALPAVGQGLDGAARHDGAVWRHDSLFVAGSRRAQGPVLAERLNAELAEYVAATWQVPSYLEMEFETHYERLLLPAVRGGGRGATKRYVGLAGRRVAIHRHGGGAARLDGAGARGTARAVPEAVRRRAGRGVPARGDWRG